MQLNYLKWTKKIQKKDSLSFGEAKKSQCGAAGMVQCPTHRIHIGFPTTIKVTVQAHSYTNSDFRFHWLANLTKMMNSRFIERLLPQKFKHREQQRAILKVDF